MRPVCYPRSYQLVEARSPVLSSRPFCACLYAYPYRLIHALIGLPFASQRSPRPELTAKPTSLRQRLVPRGPGIRGPRSAVPVSKASPTWPGSAAKAAGWLIEADRGPEHPQARSSAVRSLRSASWPKTVRPSCRPACIGLALGHWVLKKLKDELHGLPVRSNELVGESPDVNFHAVGDDAADVSYLPLLNRPRLCVHLADR